MISDQDVVDLYHYLLGRAPENEGTILAFKTYYPSIDQGRRAIFTSEEFETYRAGVTGRLASSLAVALLERAASLAPLPPAAERDPAVAAGMRLFFPADGQPRFAVVVGQPAGLRIDDLAPFGNPESAVLHITAGAAPANPGFGRLEDGTALFRIGGDAEAVATFLAAHKRQIDALYLMDATAGPHWVDRLRLHFATRAVIVLGRAHDGFDPAALDAAIRCHHNCETRIAWRGLLLSQVAGWLLPVGYDPPATIPPPPRREACPSLAVAAIVWNEAVCIENMLRSVLPVASYYAILDTGSTDATPALAQGFLTRSGVPHIVVQTDRAAYENDFSRMRNAALAMVPDWIDWVLMLDADEEMAPEDLPALMTLLAEADPATDCIALPRYNFQHADKSGDVLPYPDLQLRVLRNTPDQRVRYSGAVHETVHSVPHTKVPLDAGALGGPRGGPHIHHLVRRFRTAAEEDRKQAFYREIASRPATDPAGA